MAPGQWRPFERSGRSWVSWAAVGTTARGPGSGRCCGAAGVAARRRSMRRGVHEPLPGPLSAADERARWGCTARGGVPQTGPADPTDPSPAGRTQARPALPLGDAPVDRAEAGCRGAGAGRRRRRPLCGAAGVACQAGGLRHPAGAPGKGVPRRLPVLQGSRRVGALSLAGSGQVRACLRSTHRQPRGRWGPPGGLAPGAPRTAPAELPPLRCPRPAAHCSPPVASLLPSSPLGPPPAWCAAASCARRAPCSCSSPSRARLWRTCCARSCWRRASGKVGRGGGGRRRRRRRPQAAPAAQGALACCCRSCVLAAEAVACCWSVGGRRACRWR